MEVTYRVFALVTQLPDKAFQKLEKAATSHKPERGLNPSKEWGLDFDVFGAP